MDLLKGCFCYLCVWWHHFNSLCIIYSAYKCAPLPFPLWEDTKMSLCIKLTHYPHCWWDQWLNNVSILIPGLTLPLKSGLNYSWRTLEENITLQTGTDPPCYYLQNNLWPESSELKIGMWTTEGLFGTANILSFESSILKAVADIHILLLSDVPTVPPHPSPHRWTPACVIG